MLIKLNIIILYLLVAFFLSLIIYPFYIKFLQMLKLWKEIREDSATWDKAALFAKMHAHKKWTPTMGWWVFLIVMMLLIIVSFFLQKFWFINNTLITRQETYIVLFAFFSMWLVWLVDDWFNIKWKGKIKWMSAKVKLLWMFLFSAFISYWFFYKLWIDYINFWPFAWEISIWLFYLPVTFIFTVAIVNAINITDGLDWLAWWILLISLLVMGIITFSYKWYITTTVIGIVIWILLAFLWFNINPAKVFMWDSWALALGWLISTIIYLLNIKMWILVPFIILFGIVWIELLSSFLQIFWKKVFKRKLFPIAPFHHYLEHKWRHEHSIVMKLWLIEWVLAAVSLTMVLYQLAPYFDTIK